MGLFYFALIAGSITLLINDKKEVDKLFTAIDTYRRPFKLTTFFYIGLFGMVFVPNDFIDVSMIIRYAALYMIVSIILYGLYKNQPLRVLKIVSLLHLLGLIGRVGIDWMAWTPAELFNIIIYAAIVPLYIYIIQLVLTLNRFSTD